MWSWTNPGSAICGLYAASIMDMRLGLCENPLATERRVLRAVEELGQKPIVEYDRENEVIWVVNRVRYANRSPKVARAMQKEVERVPSSPLVARFAAMYGPQLGIEVEGG